VHTRAIDLCTIYVLHTCRSSSQADKDQVPEKDNYKELETWSMWKANSLLWN